MYTNQAGPTKAIGKDGAGKRISSGHGKSYHDVRAALTRELISSGYRMRQKKEIYKTIRCNHRIGNMLASGLRKGTAMMDDAYEVGSGADHDGPSTRNKAKRK
jgi:hypothetical protein